MKNDLSRKARILFIVVPICFCLAALTVCFCLLDSPIEEEQIIMTVVLGVWAFFIVPSVLYAVSWAKRLFDRVDPEKSFRIGYLFGDLIFLFLVLVAPVSGFIWFVITIKGITSDKRSKIVANSDVDSVDSKDIFDV